MDLGPVILSRLRREFGAISSRNALRVFITDPCPIDRRGDTTGGNSGDKNLQGTHDSVCSRGGRADPLLCLPHGHPQAEKEQANYVRTLCNEQRVEKFERRNEQWTSSKIKGDCLQSFEFLRHKITLFIHRWANLGALSRVSPDNLFISDALSE
jgi:hypothetical protein